MSPNITTLLQEIKAKTEWSEPRIAVELGTSQPTVNRILNGQSDCKGTTMMAIINLHRSVCGESTQSAETPATSIDNRGYDAPRPDSEQSGPEGDAPPSPGSLLSGIGHPPGHMKA